MLREEAEQKKNNTTSAYANQLYGGNSSPAAVGSSPSAAQSDYSSYLSAQNNALNQSRQQNGSILSRSTSGWSGNLQKKQNQTQSSGTATASTTPAASAKPAQTVLNNPNNYALSAYDSKLSVDHQQGIVDAKQRWSDADARGDKQGSWDAYVDAQVYRAMNGYIDDVGDGTGYREFTLSPADRELPEQARNAVIRYRVMGILDPDNVDYYNSKANEIRSTVAGYTSRDGIEYTKTNNVVRPEILDSMYEDTSEFVNPYAEQIEGLLDYLYSQKAWDASSYDPESDPAYQAYEKYYTRNANSASQQALANAAANTGGVANSYAQQLAAAAAQSYMKQLTDVIPTLQQNARDAYETNIGNKMSLLGSLNTMQGDAYDRFNTDRNFNMNQWLQNWQNAWNRYQLEQEIASREDEQAWQEQQNQLDRDFEKYLASLG